jgi:hypothetical protein
VTNRYTWRILNEAKRPWDVSVIISNNRGLDLYQLDIDWRWAIDREAITGVRLLALTKEYPINGKFFTQLPLPSIERQLRDAMVASEQTEVRRRTALARSRGPRPGERLTTKHLQWVADRYFEASRAGDSPRASIARLLKISPSTAAKQIMAARATGLIPASPRRQMAAATR